MKLSDLSTGPSGVAWVVIAILAVLSAVLISGHGSGLIAGYNTASKEEKEKYDEKKLCRLVGIGMGMITVLILIMILFETVLPACFAYISLGIICIICFGMILAGNFFCKK